MMQVKAKCNLNIDGKWHMGGEVFEVESTDGIAEYVEEIGYVSEVFPPEPAEKPKRSTRSRKRAE